ncbi:MAG: SnoaL-like domain-containing protein [Rhizobiales bacterium]|nr:SnoaL-like domain-containing protein [Hyphomicrobiales bacterium]
MTLNAPTIPELRRAVETRDSKSLKALYADDAVLTIIDTDNPPSRPRTISGAKEIGAFLDDVYSRDMTHTVDVGVVDGKQLAFVESCTYDDGTRVIASCTAELGPKGIVRQTIVQAWDS